MYKMRRSRELPPSEMLFNKSRLHLRFLHRKYADGEMTIESYRELVEEAAKTYALQLGFVKQLDHWNATADAVYWVKKFGIDEYHCSGKIKRHLHRMHNRDNNCGSNVNLRSRSNASAAVEKDVLKLQLPAESVFFVDSSNKFYKMLDYLKPRSPIAFDTEWQPMVSDTVLSIVQIATADRVYLIDVNSWSLNHRMWCLLIHEIFDNPDKTKIGFALNQDLNIIQKTSPIRMDKYAPGYVDLQEVWQRLKSMRITDFPYGRDDKAGNSLSAVAKLCLGKDLDKINQFSNWNKRPLRPDQLNYAALDAHCLILIYDVFKDIYAKKGLKEAYLEINIRQTGAAKQ